MCRKDAEKRTHPCRVCSHGWNDDEQKNPPSGLESAPMELKSPVPDTEVVVPRQLSISPTPVPSMLPDTHTEEAAVILESI